MATTPAIVDKVDEIAEGHPYPFIKKMRGIPLYSLRVGRYRAILQLWNRKMIVYVVKIADRSLAYQNLT